MVYFDCGDDSRVRVIHVYSSSCVCSTTDLLRICVVFCSAYYCLLCSAALLCAECVCVCARVRVFECVCVLFELLTE